jgi:hypothetical protein
VKIYTGAEREQLFGNTPVNMIQKIQGNLEFLRQSGSANDPKSGYADEQNLLSTLQSLQGKTSGVNITA